MIRILLDAEKKTTLVWIGVQYNSVRYRSCGHFCFSRARMDTANVHLCCVCDPNGTRCLICRLSA